MSVSVQSHRLPPAPRVISRSQIAAYKAVISSLNNQQGWTEDSHKQWWQSVTGKSDGSLLTKGEHATCARKMRGHVKDSHAFCAWAEHQATGHWPGEGQRKEDKAWPEGGKPVSLHGQGARSRPRPGTRTPMPQHDAHMSQHLAGRHNTWASGPWHNLKQIHAEHHALGDGQSASGHGHIAPRPRPRSQVNEAGVGGGFRSEAQHNYRKKTDPGNSHMVIHPKGSVAGYIHPSKHDISTLPGSHRPQSGPDIAPYTAHTFMPDSKPSYHATRAGAAGTIAGRHISGDPNFRGNESRMGMRAHAKRLSSSMDKAGVGWGYRTKPGLTGWKKPSASLHWVEHSSGKRVGVVSNKRRAGDNLSPDEAPFSARTFGMGPEGGALISEHKTRTGAARTIAGRHASGNPNFHAVDAPGGVKAQRKRLNNAVQDGPKRPDRTKNDRAVGYQQELVAAPPTPPHAGAFENGAAPMDNPTPTKLDEHRGTHKIHMFHGAGHAKKLPAGHAQRAGKGWNQTIPKHYTATGKHPQGEKLPTFRSEHADPPQGKRMKFGYPDTMAGLGATLRLAADMALAGSDLNLADPRNVRPQSYSTSTRSRHAPFSQTQGTARSSSQTGSSMPAPKFSTERSSAPSSSTPQQTAGGVPRSQGKTSTRAAGASSSNTPGVRPATPKMPTQKAPTPGTAPRQGTKQTATGPTRAKPVAPLGPQYSSSRRRANGGLTSSPNPRGRSGRSSSQGQTQNPRSGSSSQTRTSISTSTGSPSRPSGPGVKPTGPNTTLTGPTPPANAPPKRYVNPAHPPKLKPGQRLAEGPNGGRYVISEHHIGAPDAFWAGVNEYASSGSGTENRSYDQVLHLAEKLTSYAGTNREETTPSKINSNPPRNGTGSAPLDGDEDTSHAVRILQQLATRRA